MVDFKLSLADGTIKKDKRGIIPDGVFVVVDDERRARGEPHRARFLLELDMATHANSKFARAKIAAGAAYIKSTQYKARFGDSKGRWLVAIRMRKPAENKAQRKKDYLWAGTI